jgi:hypothetical protein
MFGPDSVPPWIDGNGRLALVRCELKRRNVSRNVREVKEKKRFHQRVLWTVAARAAPILGSHRAASPLIGISDL